MSTFPPVSVTHIGTATAVIEVGNVTFLTDPCFIEPGTYPFAPGFDLTATKAPALQPEELAVIDLVLLSHEDHMDNLDARGRLLLDGRRVLTTIDGASKLSPRPGVIGMAPTETQIVRLDGSDWSFTATPCVHVPGNECTGFIIHHESFGKHVDGRDNVIWFSGDTVYHPDLAKILAKWHIKVAILNLGQATIPGGLVQSSPLQVTMNGEDAAMLYQDHAPDVIVPMHYDEWEHFAQHETDLAHAFEKAGISHKVQWLERGSRVTISSDRQ